MVTFCWSFFGPDPSTEILVQKCGFFGVSFLASRFCWKVLFGKSFLESSFWKTVYFSFYPAKNLGAFGDGGLVTVNKEYLYKKLLALRNLGSIKKNKHFIIGKNSRLDTIQSIV